MVELFVVSDFFSTELSEIWIPIKADNNGLWGYLLISWVDKTKVIQFY